MTSHRWSEYHWSAPKRATYWGLGRSNVTRRRSKQSVLVINVLDAGDMGKKNNNNNNI